MRTQAEDSTFLSGPDAFSNGVTATGRDIDLSGVDIGTVVKARGGVGSFREMKQMQLERISIIRTTNEEADDWAENTAFRKDVLSTPWIVSEEDEERARRKAEGLDRDKRKKRKRREAEEGKRAAAEKEKRKRERKRREREQGRRGDEAGISRTSGDAEHRRDRRRDVEKATRRPKSEVSGL
ncbi:MAG: hypothetical protein ALECFALPRED_001726 [Alectoria fallacina]|uniref:Uncharacterized protein n=1 Tax=Alectoria fallacina TaxID=1903189 RepID=A0A8H3IMZ5_9LECA|nr:MAG: hypothetical protein ALECFALPRED_001726 [Alectoria fallacina]